MCLCLKKTAEVWGWGCVIQGLIYLAKSEFEKAKENFEADLKIKEQLADEAGAGKAYGNLGESCMLLGGCVVLVVLTQYEACLYQSVLWCIVWCTAHASTLQKRHNLYSPHATE